MKKVLLTVLATSVLMASGSVMAMDKGLESKLENICEAAKSDSAYKLDFAIKKGHYKYKDVVDGLVCNGEDVVTFAKLHGAERTANLLLSRSGNGDKEVVIQDIAKN